MYDASRHHRQSIRLPGYDYSTPGHYFITVCSLGREPVFGAIHDGVTQPSAAGRMVASWWRELPNKFLHVEPGEFVVMPDHFHGLIELTDGSGRTAAPLPAIMQWFKTMTANAHLRAGGGKLWQRGYFECIIRDAWHLHQVIRYIRQNPARWTPPP